jgi:beta-phosphoglucomutase-like phosphatase (HAD superfamily)
VTRIPDQAKLEAHASLRLPVPALDVLGDESPKPLRAARELAAELTGFTDWRYDPSYEIRRFEQALEALPESLVPDDACQPVRDAFARHVVDRDRAKLRVDGVLVDLAPLWQATLDEVARAQGIEVDLEHAIDREEDPLVAGDALLSGDDQTDDDLPVGVASTSSLYDALERPATVLASEARDVEWTELARAVNELLDDHELHRASDAPSAEALREPLGRRVVSAYRHAATRKWTPRMARGRLDAVLDTARSNEGWFFDLTIETLRDPLPEQSTDRR